MDLLHQLEQTALLIFSAFPPQITMFQSVLHKSKILHAITRELEEAREHVLHVPFSSLPPDTGFYSLPSHIRNTLQCQSPTGWGLGITDSHFPFSHFMLVI